MVFQQSTLAFFIAGSQSKTFYRCLIWLKWLVCASDTKNKQTIKNWAMKMTQTTQITSRKLGLFLQVITLGPEKPRGSGD